MENFVLKINHEESNNISVCFYIERDKIMEIGEKMEEINDEAYMNGYNWEAFLNHYLQMYYPEVLTEMGSDPEAGMYVAYYKGSPKNEKRADKLVEIINDLVSDENKIYKFVEKEGENIEWD